VQEQLQQGQLQQVHHLLQLIQVTFDILALQFHNLVPKELVQHLALTLPLGLDHPQVPEVQPQLALHHLLEIFFLVS
jgi:hypothetical protein